MSWELCDEKIVDILRFRELVFREEKIREKGFEVRMSFGIYRRERRLMWLEYWEYERVLEDEVREEGRG